MDDSHRIREEILDFLKEIRDLQQEQLNTLRALLEAQQAHTELYKNHMERVERINDKTEQIQNRGANLMGTARRMVFIVLAAIVVLVFYSLWILLQY